MLPFPWSPEIQQFTAIAGCAIFLFMGSLLMVLWADQRHTAEGRSRIQFGLMLVCLGLAFGLFGMWLMGPVLIALVAWIIYNLTVAVYSLCRPLSQSVAVEYPDVNRDYTPAVREHLKQRWQEKV